MLFLVDPRTGADRGIAPGVDDQSQSSSLKPETEEEFQLVERALAGHREERVRLEGESEAPGKSIGGVGGRPIPPKPMTAKPPTTPTMAECKAPTARPRYSKSRGKTG